MSAPAALERRLSYSGPALFSYGFRPFFLAGAAWAVVALALWIAQLAGRVHLPVAMTPLDWHFHEMLYGYAGAVIAGFLLTAIPNWTGRLPVCGGPLAALAAIWLAGRIAMGFSAMTGAWIAAGIDIAFLVVLAVVSAREIVAGRNWRNLRVLAVLGVLIAGNVVFHTEVLVAGVADYGVRIGIGAVIMLITLVGGRIVPSFTRNWLARTHAGRLPVPFSRYDAATIAVSAMALAAWVVLPGRAEVGVLLLAAAGLQAGRLASWAGDRTLSDRLVLILHVGYGFVPLGFGLLGLALIDPAQIPPSVGIHAWTAGAIGLMTLAVMTRASLGHTGQPLTASGGTQLIYLSALTAAVLRMAAAFYGSPPLMDLAAVAWIAAFAGFVALYGPLLGGRPPVWMGRR